MFQLKSNKVDERNERKWLKSHNIRGKYGGKYTNVYVPIEELMKTLKAIKQEKQRNLPFEKSELTGKPLKSMKKRNKHKKWLL